MWWAHKDSSLGPAERYQRHPRWQPNFCITAVDRSRPTDGTVIYSLLYNRGHNPLGTGQMATEIGRRQTAAMKILHKDPGHPWPTRRCTSHAWRSSADAVLA